MVLHQLVLKTTVGIRQGMLNQLNEIKSIGFKQSRLFGNLLEMLI
jgi:hypothetical protein